jgi:hypothetical protein
VKHRIAFINLPHLAVFLVLASTAALASSTWYVDGVHGSDSNNCKSRQHACKTIGHAISLASSGDSIMVAAATYTENLTIGFSLKVLGSGAKTTIIDGGGVNTVVAISTASAHVSLSKMTIRNGFAATGGGINNSGRLTISNITVSGNRTHPYCFARGGGINNSYGGRLTINNSTLSANSASGHCMHGSAAGGGISNGGTLTIDNSTLSANSAPSSGGIDNGGTLTVNNSTLSENSGGGIFNGGTLTINNSTLSENHNSSLGGGIYNDGTLTINNSTLSGNSAPDYVYGGGIYNGNGTLTINNSTLSGNSAGGGGGIANFNAATLQNSIIASNSGGNCAGTMTSNGYNLSSDGTCNFNNTGDLNNTDPKLGPLRNNGGPTQTQALLSGSPAIDAGNPSGCTDGQGHLLKTDQRGKPRPDKEDTGGCDMGAYERQTD